MRLRALAALACLSGALAVGCARNVGGARNVILFIGDGLGAAQTALGIEYARRVEGRRLNLELVMRDGNTGYTLTAVTSRTRPPPPRKLPPESRHGTSPWR